MYTFDNLTRLIVHFRWFLGEVELSGQTSNVLTLYDMGRDKHGQKVACEGTNSVGSTRHEYNLNIECKFVIVLVKVLTQ